MKPEKANRSRGRPRDHTDEQLAAVLQLMGDEGISLKEAAAKGKVGYATIRQRIADSPPLQALYARAREDFAETAVQQMNAIARTEKDVQRARLLCDNVKWFAAKVLPKLYADRHQLEHTGGANGAPLNNGPVSKIDLARRIAWILSEGLEEAAKGEKGEQVQ